MTESDDQLVSKTSWLWVLFNSDVSLKMWCGQWSDYFKGKIGDKSMSHPSKSGTILLSEYFLQVKGLFECSALTSGSSFAHHCLHYVKCHWAVT